MVRGMHWALSVSEAFSLSKVLQRSQRFLCPPFRVGGHHETLYRVERLSSGQTIQFSVTQMPMGLLLQTRSRLNSSVTEELSRKTWRMLRIGENLEPFVEIARHTPELVSVIDLGGQFLRGTTLFEDVVKAVVLAHCHPENDETYLRNISWIVDRFGEPLPINPTMHAFPTPAQFVLRSSLHEDVLGVTVTQQLARVLNAFQTCQEEMVAFVDTHPDISSLEAGLRDFLDLDDRVMGLVMLSLGRYNYIPVDPRAQQRVGRYLKATASPENVRALFLPWQPWGGLAYWLWDWSSPVTSSRVERVKNLVG